jgi:hypothetical protein
MRPSAFARGIARLRARVVPVFLSRQCGELQISCRRRGPPFADNRVAMFRRGGAILTLTRGGSNCGILDLGRRAG